MKTKLIRLRRVAYSAVALAMTIAILLPGLAQEASAAQVQNRSIEMGTAVPGATTTYKLTFDPNTVVSATSSIIVDFCSNSPIPGDHCTATAGTDVPDTTGASGTGVTPIEDTSNDGTTTQHNTFHTVAISPADLSGGPGYSVEITGLVNPTNVDHFYARIFVYSTDSGGSSSSAYAPDGGGATAAVPTEGSYVDYGGAALSTVESIQVTAKVQEQLTFCTSNVKVSTLGGAADCSVISYPTNDPALTLGHGSTTQAIDSSAIDTGSVYSQISTNASQGAAVRMVAGNSCSNLSGSPDVQAGLSNNGGSTCDIEGLDSHTGSPATMTAGSPAGDPGGAFGLCIDPGANSTADGSYADAGCSGVEGDNSGAGFASTAVKFGMDPAVNATYGSQIFHTSGPVSKVDDTLNFAATATLTTPAGIYTGSESLVATGEF